MKHILGTAALREIPLAEITLEMDSATLHARFNVIGDLDFEITLRKQYDSPPDALKAYDSLIHSQAAPTRQEVPEGSFSMRQAAAQIELLARLIDGKLPLPDQGNGFTYDGDLAYARKLMAQLQSAVS